MVGLLLALPILLPKSIREQARGRSSQGWLDWWMPTGSVVPLLLACSILSYIIGQIIWTLNENVLHMAVLFPSWADVGYLAAYPLALLAILFLPRQRRSPTNRPRIIFDAVIAMIGVVTFSWYFVLGPSIMHGDASMLGSTGRCHLSSMYSSPYFLPDLANSTQQPTRDAPCHLPAVPGLCGAYHYQYDLQLPTTPQ